MDNCPGGLIEHADGTIAGCTIDDDEDGCPAASYYMRATRCGAGCGCAAAATTAASTRYDDASPGLFGMGTQEEAWGEASCLPLLLRPRGQANAGVPGASVTEQPRMTFSRSILRYGCYLP